jgi:hypothetical protein
MKKKWSDNIIEKSLLLLIAILLMTMIIMFGNNAELMANNPCKLCELQTAKSCFFIGAP